MLIFIYIQSNSNIFWFIDIQIQLIQIMANRYFGPSQILVNSNTHSNFKFEGKVKFIAITKCRPDPPLPRTKTNSFFQQMKAIAKSLLNQAPTNDIMAELRQPMTSFIEKTLLNDVETVIVSVLKFSTDQGPLL